MTIILFLVDTSSSMNQRTYLGTSLIDIAKASVETFMKVNSVAKYVSNLSMICSYFLKVIYAIFILSFRSDLGILTADGIGICSSRSKIRLQTLR